MLSVILRNKEMRCFQKVISIVYKKHIARVVKKQNKDHLIIVKRLKPKWYWPHLPLKAREPSLPCYFTRERNGFIRLPRSLVWKWAQQCSTEFVFVFPITLCWYPLHYLHIPLYGYCIWIWPLNRQIKDKLCNRFEKKKKKISSWK